MYYVISYQDSETQRYDVSRHSKLVDAQAQLTRVASLPDVRIEEKETYDPKPLPRP